jgi:hypothetical protein
MPARVSACSSEWHEDIRLSRRNLIVQGFSIPNDALYEEPRSAERGKGRAEVEERIGLDHARLKPYSEGGPFITPIWFIPPSPYFRLSTFYAVGRGKCNQQKSLEQS